MDFELDHQRVTLEHVNNRPQKVKGGDLRPAADLKVTVSMDAAVVGELFMGDPKALAWAWKANSDELEGTSRSLSAQGAAIASLAMARRHTGLALVVHSAMDAGPDLVTVDDVRVEEVRLVLEMNEVVKVAFKVKAAGLSGDDIGELTEQWCHDEAIISLFRRQQEAPLSHKDAPQAAETVAA